MATGRGEAAFLRLGIAKQRADPLGRTRSPLPHTGSPAGQTQLMARCEARHWPPAPGLDWPHQPSQLLHRLAGTRYRGDVHSVHITLRQPCAPNTCYHHGEPATGREGKQAYVSLFTRSGERLPAAPIRIQLPSWILQLATWTVRANN